MALRVAVLCSDDAHHRYLVATLAARFDVVAVVVEPAASQLRGLRRRGAWRDYGWALYHAARRRLAGLDARRRAEFALPRSGPAELPDVEVVESINDPAACARVAAQRPDVTVVMGTTILRAPVLARLGPVVLNLHGGYLPHYRGNHCFFFALYAGDADRIGSTIHFVDEGVDTGDIVAHVVPPMMPGDDAEGLYCRAQKLAIHHLVRVLARYERTGWIPRRAQSPGGRAYRRRDRKPHHDLLHWLRVLAGRRPLPLHPVAEIRDACAEPAASAPPPPTRAGALRGAPGG
ncbi:MAG TPA: formyl transferase [Longimicrobium sp.]|nr:formyl transferase [Longimicrobium sp.]